MNKIVTRDQPAKEIDIARVINHLNHAFEEATAKMGRPISPFLYSTKDGKVSRNSDFPYGNQLYQLQTKFTHYVDDILRGASYISPKVIQECNEFILGIVATRKEEVAA